MKSIWRHVIIGALVASATAVASVARAGEAGGLASCATCKGPKWSWDTVPVAFHSAESTTGPSGTYTAAEMETISRFPLVTIEKWQGSEAKDSEGNPVFLWEEDAMVASAQDIKKHNQDASVVVWLDSMRIYTGWWFPPQGHTGVNHTLNPDAREACSTGHFRPAGFLETHRDPYVVMGADGSPAMDSWSHCHLFGFDQQPARDYWRDMCLNLTASGVIDGCGADASWQLACQPPSDWDGKGRFNCTKLGYGMNATTAYGWDRGRHQALRDTTSALGDGLLLGKVPGEILTPEDFGEQEPYVNGVLHEGCDASNGTVMTLRNLTQYSRSTGRRVVYECHQSCSKAPANETCLPNVAAFLAGAGEYHYFVTGGWQSSAADEGSFKTHWIPGLFDRPLGAPLGDAVYDESTDEWRRAFASGTKVTFNARTNEGSIQWGSG